MRNILSLFTLLLISTSIITSFLSAQEDVVKETASQLPEAKPQIPDANSPDSQTNEAVETIKQTPENTEQTSIDIPEIKPVSISFIAPDNLPANLLVVPFNSYSKRVGRNTAKLFNEALKEKKILKVIEDPLAFKAWEEYASAPSNVTRKQILGLAQKANAAGVIYGKVTKYDMSKERSFPTVGISIEILDGVTGDIILKCSHSEMSSNPAAILSDQARIVIAKMIESIKSQILIKTQMSNIGVKKSKSQEPSNFDLPRKKPPVNLDARANLSVSEQGLRKATLTWSYSKKVRPRFIIIERSDTIKGPFDKIDRISGSKRKYIDTDGKDNQIEDDKTYFYRIRTIMVEGQPGVDSAVKPCYMVPRPAPPIEVQLSANKPRSIEIKWNSSPSKFVTHYIIQRSTTEKPDEFKDVKKIREGKNIHEDSGERKDRLKDEYGYLYRIAAINEINVQGKFSPSFLVKTAPPPTAVNNFEVTELEVRCVPLKWDEHESIDVIGYNIYRGSSVSGPFEKLTYIKGKNKTTHIDGGDNPGNLKDDTTHYYKIAAINKVNNIGTETTVIRAKTRAIPPVVENINAISDLPRYVDLTWDISSDEKVTKYEIHRSNGQDFEKIATLKGLETNSFRDFGGRKSNKKYGKLADSKIYLYKVFALNKANASSLDSTVVEAKTKSLPKTPIGLTGKRIDEKNVEIKFNANTEKNIAEYVLEYSRHEDKGWKKQESIIIAVGETEVNHQFKKSKSNKNLYVRVYAKDKYGLDGVPTTAAKID